MGGLRRRSAPLRLLLARAILFAFVFGVDAHFSKDNILRIQLWDADGLSKEPQTTKPTYLEKSTVNLDTLWSAMLREEYGANEYERFVRHKVRHKRRRPRDNRHFWHFHSGEKNFNVQYDDFWDNNLSEASNEYQESNDNGEGLIEPAAGDSQSGFQENISPGAGAVSSVRGASLSGVNGSRQQGDPMARRDTDEETIEDVQLKKQLAVVPKCCASGQNLSTVPTNGRVQCVESVLTFQPAFFESNGTHLLRYEGNLFETIVGNPCSASKYKLDPSQDQDDLFFLLVNGSLFLPRQDQTMYHTKEYCMETFWNDSDPAGLTLPVVCFHEAVVEATTPSITLIAYAAGLILSVPFLVCTVLVYILVRELRDTHGKALACHSTCLAIAFSCLATTQLSGHIFSQTVCTTMAYVIQFSFVSCFFWLNVMCFDTWLNVRHYLASASSRKVQRKRFAWYAVYAILLPLTLLAITLSMDLLPAVPSAYLKPNFGVTVCWFKTDEAALPYFYGPVACVLFFNVILFFLISRAFASQFDKLNCVTVTELTHPDFATTDDWLKLNETLDLPIVLEDTASTPEHERNTNFKHRWNKYKKIFRKCLLLSCLMGISWIMEVISWAAGGSDGISVWSVFDVINALQGIVIFAIFVLQQPIRSFVWRKLKRKWQRGCRRYQDDSEQEVSERTIIDCERQKRAYV